MAATPTLVPDPAVIAVQGVLFLSAVVLVKKLMLDPYDRLRSLRNQQTSGSSEKAKSLSVRNSELTIQVDRSISDALNQAKADAESARQTWQGEREKIVSEAEAQANELTTRALKQLKDDLNAQEAKVTEEASKLSKQIVDALTQ